MKEGIVGCITGLINMHQASAESFKDSGETIAVEYTHNAVARELEDLLDFIEDSKEDIQSSETVYRADQYKSLVKQVEQLKECLHDGDAERIVLRKRIRELEDSCENFAEVERNLLNKNELLKGTLKEALPFLPQGYRDNIKTVLEGKYNDRR